MKKTKKILTIVCLLAMIIGCLVFQAYAAGDNETEMDTPIPPVSDVTTGYCGGEGDGTNLEWSLDSEGTLTITGTGAMADYTFDDNAPWYANYSSIETVIISDGVTTVGEYAFFCCDRLTSVTIPDSVTTIGDSSFGSCTRLTDVTFGDSVTTIDHNAFCACNSLTDVTIPDSVTTIGDWAFASCRRLASVSIGDGVSSIGGMAFSRCDNLTEITASTGNSLYSSEDGILFDKEKTMLIQYPAGNSRTSYDIPYGVKTICDGAFAMCDSLTSVTIPDSVTTIEINAFSGCSNLTSVTIPDSVTTIKGCAFVNCRQLADVYFEGNAPTVGTYGFDADTVTLYYIPGTTGWTDSEAYDAAAGTWNGYKLAEWNVAPPSSDWEEQGSVELTVTEDEIVLDMVELFTSDKMAFVAAYTPEGQFLRLIEAEIPAGEQKLTIKPEWEDLENCRIKVIVTDDEETMAPACTPVKNFVEEVPEEDVQNDYRYGYFVVEYTDTGYSVGVVSFDGMAGTKVKAADQLLDTDAWETVMGPSWSDAAPEDVLGRYEINGSGKIDQLAVAEEVPDGAYLQKGETEIVGTEVSVSLDTQFMVRTFDQDTETYTYTVYVGYNSLPNALFGAYELINYSQTVSYLTDEKGLATYVFVDVQAHFEKWTSETDHFGRPMVQITDEKGNVIDSEPCVATPVGVCTGRMDSAAFSFLEPTSVTTYMDGKVQVGYDTLKAAVNLTGNGILTEVFYNTQTGEAVVVAINTYIAEVVAVSETYNYLQLSNGAKFELNDHEVMEEDIVLYHVYFDSDGNKAILYDIKAVTPVVADIESVVTQDTSVYYAPNGDYFYAGGVKYLYTAFNFNLSIDEDLRTSRFDPDCPSRLHWSAIKTTYDIYLDEYGYAIYLTPHAKEKTFMIVEEDDATKTQSEDGSYAYTAVAAPYGEDGTIVAAEAEIDALTYDYMKHLVWKYNAASDGKAPAALVAMTPNKDDEPVLALREDAAGDAAVTLDDFKANYMVAEFAQEGTVLDSETFALKEGEVYATTKTIFMIRTLTGDKKNPYAYEQVTGYKNLPGYYVAEDLSRNGDGAYTSIQYFVDENDNNFAAYVFIDVYYTEDANHFILLDKTNYGYGFAAALGQMYGGDYYAYNAIVDGEQSIVLAEVGTVAAYYDVANDNVKPGALKPGFLYKDALVYLGVDTNANDKTYPIYCYIEDDADAELTDPVQYQYVVDGDASYVKIDGKVCKVAADAEIWTLVAEGGAPTAVHYWFNIAKQTGDLSGWTPSDDLLDPDFDPDYDEEEDDYLTPTPDKFYNGFVVMDEETNEVTGLYHISENTDEYWFFNENWVPLG